MKSVNNITWVYAYVGIQDCKQYILKSWKLKLHNWYYTLGGGGFENSRKTSEINERYYCNTCA